MANATDVVANRISNTARLHSRADANSSHVCPHNGTKANSSDCVANPITNTSVVAR